ncbi:hypothetical protein [Pseudomonas sp. FP2309]|uniref:hypothetical protein n=1 Tax=Pseudomonas sp. FP2309 TaxID=2954091 RepID=UPI002734C1BD|nr:hypothetical protein [Pseudomonas sp. FP2309]WLH69689.1 hypothetical protein PSH59_06100 [Pseudomonas sp. FP2309]
MVEVIPVALRPEPNDFNVEVRQKGLAWLAKHNIHLNSAPPKASKLPRYWAHSNLQLWKAYSGTCAYLAIYFEWSTGASSTDHFIAKSTRAGDAYEWDNYRLSCLGANRSKGAHSVLDPIGLTPNTFFLNLAKGNIRVNPALATLDKKHARRTMTRLKLNAPELKAARARHYQEYTEHKHQKTFKKLSPFVWYEANRQGLL